MSGLQFVFVVYLVVVNLVALVVYGVDKWRSRRGMWRVRECRLLGIAVAGGGIGAALGMYWFRHKTKRLKFVIGVPLAIVLWVVGGVFFCFCR